jgi:hypothetical protein
MENLNDLLNKNNQQLEIREHNVKGFLIPNLTEQTVKTEKEAMEYLYFMFWLIKVTLVSNKGNSQRQIKTSIHQDLIQFLEFLWR